MSLRAEKRAKLKSPGRLAHQTRKSRALREKIRVFENRFRQALLAVKGDAPKRLRGAGAALPLRGSPAPPLTAR